MRRAVLVVCLVGCVDEFKGSNVQFDFATTTPVQASAGAAPRPGEVASDVHFTFYAFDEGTDSTGAPVGRLYSVQDFEIHRIVDPASPCFIDVGAHVPFPGLHVSMYAEEIAKKDGFLYDATAGILLASPPPGVTDAQKIEAATAQQRMFDIAALASDQGIKVITSADDSSYPAVAADCNDTSSIPPPTCTDAASNARRLAQCQDFWSHHKNYFEGTDRVLTAPLNGITHGFVDGLNPVNLGPVGGAQFFVDAHLDSFTGYAIYQQTDGMTGPGTLFLFGTPTSPTRGVIHVHMTSPAQTGVTADVAIFANLDQDNTNF